MKKWKNRGHEFDEVGQKFIENHNIVLIGDKKCCEEVKEKLAFLKQKINILEKKQVKTSFNIFNKLKIRNKTVIIVDPNPYEAGLFITEMEKRLHLKQNSTIFWSKDFFDKYLSIFAVYVADKVYFSSNCFICTTVCNLNCKNCLNFKPYDKNTHHNNINELKKSIDLYFSVIDRVGLFHISGGEPFLYPHLKELIEYIGDKYRNKIDILGTVTNSTVLPSEDLCKIFKKYDVRVEVDDYTKTLPRLQEKFKCTVNILLSNNVKVQINQPVTWLSIYPLDGDSSLMDEESLRKKFFMCNNNYCELKGEEITSCNYSDFAVQAGLIKKIKNEYYNLNYHTELSKKELIEFRLGYSEKGYVEFCRLCNGHEGINKGKEIPAEQAHGMLSCDKSDTCNIKMGF